jgi:hypothetical protein
MVRGRGHPHLNFVRLLKQAKTSVTFSEFAKGGEEKVLKVYIEDKTSHQKSSQTFIIWLKRK